MVRAAQTPAPAVDPIKAEVVARFLLATAEEMGATLQRTAFSPNIKERADCSTAVFDRQGQMVALAQRVPIHLGSMVGAVDEILRRYPESEIRPGDMFVADDPYNGGGTHLPDIDVIAAALSQALPDKALAGSGPHHLYVLSGTNPRTGRYFVNYETLAGGMGARTDRDGVDGVRVHASGSSNLPIEALEHAYPFRVERYALQDDSAGAG